MNTSMDNEVSKYGSYHMNSDYVIFRKGFWVIRKSDGFEKPWNSVIMHQCGDEKHNTSSFVPIRTPFKGITCHAINGGDCCACLEVIPTEILGLWFLHNMDILGKGYEK